LKRIINVSIKTKYLGLKDQNERLKEENEYYNFKLKIADEKERIHENNLNSLKDLQNQYEEQKRSLHSEYKNKEDKLRKKFEGLEESTIGRYKEREVELVEKLESLSEDHTNLLKSFDNLEKERDSLKETILKQDKVIRVREDEFEQILHDRDTKMNEMELYIRSISEEANLQITKLSNSVLEFNEKLNYYKNRELDLSHEVTKLHKQAEHSELVDLNKSRDIMQTAEMRLVKLLEENKHLNKSLEEMNIKLSKKEGDYNVKLFNPRICLRNSHLLKKKIILSKRKWERYTNISKIRIMI
jgi:chromosome segregation ATPase